MNLAHAGKASALEIAAIHKREATVQLLLDNGADVNQVAGTYGCPLGYASVGKGNVGNIIQLLVDNGADINLEGGRYGSALGSAAESGNEETIQLLLDLGADVNLVGGEFGSPLATAAASDWRGNRESVIRFLLQNGADVTLKDENGCTALMHAHKKQSVVQILLDHGADPREIDGWDLSSDPDILSLYCS